MAVSKTLRYQVLRRDGFRCRGGADEPANLVTACRPCNGGKAASNPDASLVDQVAEDALRWSQAMRWAAEIQASEREQRNAYINAFADAWNGWTIGGEQVWIPNDWSLSIGHFYDLGLELAVVVDLMETAMHRQIPERKTFAYLCVCCWNVIKERQEMARQAVVQEED